MLAEDNEHPSEYVLRYLKTLAAWDYTISQTTRLEIFFPDMVPRLFITDTPRPKKYGNGFNFRPRTRAQASFNHRLLRRDVLANFVRYFNQTKKQFGGIVHCEASLMGLTVLHMIELLGWTDSHESFVALEEK